MILCLLIKHLPSAGSYRIKLDNYLVAEHLQPYLNAIKKNYCLRLINMWGFPPSQIQGNVDLENTVVGALVMVSFKLRTYGAIGLQPVVESFQLIDSRR